MFSIYIRTYCFGNYKALPIIIIIYIKLRHIPLTNYNTNQYLSTYYETCDNFIFVKLKFIIKN